MRMTCAAFSIHSERELQSASPWFTACSPSNHNPSCSPLNFCQSANPKPLIFNLKTWNLIQFTLPASRSCCECELPPHVAEQLQSHELPHSWGCWEQCLAPLPSPQTCPAATTPWASICAFPIHGSLTAAAPGLSPCGCCCHRVTLQTSHTVTLSVPAQWGHWGS